MKEERGSSQVLFGFLPDQTVDLKGSVWRVSEWVDPIPLSLDQETVRQSLLQALRPWTQTGQDDGLDGELRKRIKIDVVGVNTKRGVLVEQFPKQWRCKGCGRISESPDGGCKCGHDRKAQMHFVAYHSCGAMKEAYMPRCNQHHAVAVALPGTATAREIRFFCPDCNKTLSKGYPNQRCSCRNGSMSITVHRAGVVFTPRITVIVNPPDPAEAAKLRAAGGPAKALDWVLNGMETNDPITGPQTYSGFMDMLRNTNISEETARLLADQALAKGDIRADSTASRGAIPEPVRREAQDEAFGLALAATEGRITINDLLADPDNKAKILFETAYRQKISEVGLEGVDLLSSFPVATLAFGYTRADFEPGASRLVPFRSVGDLRVYGQLYRTEALLFRLDPIKVYRWLLDNGYLEGAAAESARNARIGILEKIEIPYPTQDDSQDLGKAVLTLLHSYAHRAIRHIAAHAGIERDSLAEYLAPHHLSFIIYAASRSDFVLGGLQAVFETSLHTFLNDFINAEHRCPLDPGCRTGGGACMACLHIGEPSCRWFNRFLNRDVLFGENGFLRLGRE
jgi:hypothetical protein